MTRLLRPSISLKKKTLLNSVITMRAIAWFIHCDPWRSKNSIHKIFPEAVGYYLVLKNYEDPESFETIRQISLCQFYLGNYQESLHALKQLHNLRPYNMELVYRIGMLNLEKLENPEEALVLFQLWQKNI